MEHKKLLCKSVFRYNLWYVAGDPDNSSRHRYRARLRLRKDCKAEPQLHYCSQGKETVPICLKPLSRRAPPTRSEPGVSAMNVDIDLDETQAAIVEPVGEKRKEDDVTRELLDDAAKRAAKEVMKEMAQ